MLRRTRGGQNQLLRHLWPKLDLIVSFDVRMTTTGLWSDIVLPAALPAIFTGLRLAVGAGWLTVVTAEMLAVKSGLGYMILNGQLTFRSDLIIAGIIVIGGIGLLADQLVRLVRARVCRWQEGLTASPI